MTSTDKSTPTYITPLRRSLGLSRRLNASGTRTNTPITPSSATTPLRTTHYNSPSFRKINNENTNTTPGSLNTTPQICNLLMSPLKAESVNRTSSKRGLRLSLSKSTMKDNPLMIKKKKLEFLESSDPADEVVENSFQSLPKSQSVEAVETRTTDIDTDDDYISPSQAVSFEMLTQIPNNELECNEELANELKEIELLKQKQYRRRISYGLKVREDKLKDLEELKASLPLKDLCKVMSPAQADGGFHTARQEIEMTQVQQNGGDKQKQHEEQLNEIKQLIKIWRRGLRDALEYLSCLSYPPTDIQSLLKHHNIPPELLLDK